MTLRDLHVHTNFGDGNSSPEYIAEKAYDMGVSLLGFSEHSYTYFDESYCMNFREYANYAERISALKKKYEGKMRILCGLELDINTDVNCAEFDRKLFDYYIASCHYLEMGGKILAIDESKEDLINKCNTYYSGDMIKMAVQYYEVLADFIVKFKPDIVGHFDYIAKDNVNCKMFDDSDPRYVKAWKAAADKILTTCNLFEINTGCISRGYRPYPYPSKEIVNYLKDKGAEFILASDAHDPENLCYKFKEFQDYA